MKTDLSGEEEVRILVVDDNTQNRYMLEVLLHSQGYGVVTAKNGIDALAHLKNQRFDAIVSDILMPGMDGFQLIRECKRDPVLQDIPFLFYTATYTEPGDRDLGIALGAVRYIIKPAEPDAFMAEIQEVLSMPEIPKSPARDDLVANDTVFSREYTSRVVKKLEKKNQALEESEKKFRKLFESMAQGVVYQGPDGHIIDANPAAERILGLSLDQLIGRTSRDPRWKAVHEDGSEFPGEDHPSMVALATRQPVRGVMGVCNPVDGETHWIQVSATPLIIDGSPAPVQVFTTFEDITELKNTERMLRETSQYLQNLIRYASAPIIVWNPASEITEFNHAAELLTGMSRESTIGKNLELLFPPESRSVSMELIHRAYHGDRWEAVEIPVAHVSGEVRTVLWNSSNIRGPEGHVIATIAQGQDITERKKAEDKVRLTHRKLVLMNDITYQDIQNKVTALRGYVEISQKLTGEADRAAIFEKENAILAMIHSLINNTKEFQQIKADQSRWVALENIITAEWAFLSRSKEISFQVDLKGLEVYTEPLIARVFANLLENSMKHGEKVKRISIGCRKSQGVVIIIYEDDGIGIPAAKKPYLFERVVAGYGTFGLFFVREFLALSRMQITECGVPGIGVRFEITVPGELCRFPSG